MSENPATITYNRYAERLPFTLDEVKNLPYPFDNKFLVMALVELTSRLPDNISVVVSDDLSGRWPAEILWQLVTQKQYLHPPAFQPFLGGMRVSPIQQQWQREVISQHQDWHYALIVTEHINTGQSMLSFLQPFIAANINYTIAAVSIGQRPDQYPQEISGHLISGGFGDWGNYVLHRKYALVGATRSSECSQPIPVPAWHQEVEVGKQVQEIIYNWLLPLVKS